MNFGDKVKNLRKEKGLTQRELGDRLGLSMRTIGSYESGTSYPKSRSIYTKMAEIFSVEENYLKIENEAGRTGPDTDDSSEKAKNLIEELSAMFAGGRLSEEDKDAVMRALQDAYWDAKKDRK